MSTRPPLIVHVQSSSPAPSSTSLQIDPSERKIAVGANRFDFDYLSKGNGDVESTVESLSPHLLNANPFSSSSSSSAFSSDFSSFPLPNSSLPAIDSILSGFTTSYILIGSSNLSRHSSLFGSGDHIGLIESLFSSLHQYLNDKKKNTNQIDKENILFELEAQQVFTQHAVDGIKTDNIVSNISGGSEDLPTSKSSPSPTPSSSAPLPSPSPIYSPVSFTSPYVRLGIHSPSHLNYLLSSLSFQFPSYEYRHEKKGIKSHLILIFRVERRGGDENSNDMKLMVGKWKFIILAGVGGLSIKMNSGLGALNKVFDNILSQANGGNSSSLDINSPSFQHLLSSHPLTSLLSSSLFPYREFTQIVVYVGSAKEKESHNVSSLEFGTKFRDFITTVQKISNQNNPSNISIQPHVFPYSLQLSHLRQSVSELRRSLQLSTIPIPTVPDSSSSSQITFPIIDEIALRELQRKLEEIDRIKVIGDWDSRRLKWKEIEEWRIEMMIEEGWGILFNLHYDEEREQIQMEKKEKDNGKGEKEKKEKDIPSTLSSLFPLASSSLDAISRLHQSLSLQYLEFKQIETTALASAANDNGNADNGENSVVVEKKRAVEEKIRGILEELKPMEGDYKRIIHQIYTIQQKSYYNSSSSQSSSSLFPTSPILSIGHRYLHPHLRISHYYNPLSLSHHMSHDPQFISSLNEINEQEKRMRSELISRGIVKEEESGKEQEEGSQLISSLLNDIKQQSLYSTRTAYERDSLLSSLLRSQYEYAMESEIQQRNYLKIFSEYKFAQKNKFQRMENKYKLIADEAMRDSMRLYEENQRLKSKLEEKMKKGLSVNH